MKKILLLLFPLLVSNLSFGQFKTPTNWDWQYPKLYDGDFKSITKVSDGIIAVGDKSSIVKSKDGGSTWKQINFATEHDFVAVVFLPDEKTGYLFSNLGEVFKSTNSGDTWATDGSFPNVADTVYNASKFQDTIAVYYRGKADKKNYLAILTTSTSWSKSKLTHSIDNGQYPFYWTNRYFGNYDTICFYDKVAIVNSFNKSIIGATWFSSLNKLIICCNSFSSTGQNIYSNSTGTFVANGTTNVQGKIFAYDENTWYLQQSFPFPGFAQLWKTTDAGSTFTSLGIPSKIYDIYFIDAYEAFGACEKAQIITTVNAGSLWTNSVVHEELEFNIGVNKYQYTLSNITTGRNGVIYGIGFCKSDAAKLEGNCIMKTTDFGKTWELLKVYMNSSIQKNSDIFIRRFFAFDDSHFIVLKYKKRDMQGFSFGGGTTSAYVEYHYYNGDFSTSLMYSIDGDTYGRGSGVVDMYPFDFHSSICVGYDYNSNKFNCVFTNKLDQTNTGFTQNLVSNSLVSTGALQTISFADANVGFVAGSGGKIFRTIDGGSVWKDVSVAGVLINNIQCINKDTAIVVANGGGFFRTYNASDISVTWTAKSLKTSDNISYLNFYNGQNGFVLSNDYIHVTHDGGNSFQKISIPFNYWGSFDTTSFSNINIAKLTGNVLSGNADISAFLLVNNPSISVLGSVLTLGSIGGSTNSISAAYSLPDYGVFPNPANNDINIYIEIYSNSSIQLLDILGKEISRIEVKSQDTNINISDLSKGIYIIRVIRNHENVRQVKFLKE